LRGDCMINLELRNSGREIQNKRDCGMESNTIFAISLVELAKEFW
jgi:hypothetical protein